MSTCEQPIAPAATFLAKCAVEGLPLADGECEGNQRSLLTRENVTLALTEKGRIAFSRASLPI